MNHLTERSPVLTILIGENLALKKPLCLVCGGSCFMDYEERKYQCLLCGRYFVDARHVAVQEAERILQRDMRRDIFATPELDLVIGSDLVPSGS